MTYWSPSLRADVIRLPASLPAPENINFTFDFWLLKSQTRKHIPYMYVFLYWLILRSVFTNHLWILCQKCLCDNHYLIVMDWKYSTWPKWLSRVFWFFVLFYNNDSTYQVLWDSMRQTCPLLPSREAMFPVKLQCQIGQSSKHTYW